MKKVLKSNGKKTMFMVISTKIVPKKYKKLKFGWFFSQNGWLTGGFGGCVGVLTKKWVTSKTR